MCMLQKGNGLCDQNKIWVFYRGSVTAAMQNTGRERREFTALSIYQNTVQLIGMYLQNRHT